MVWLGVALAFLAGVALVWRLAPREPVVTRVHFDTSQLRGGVDAYLAAQESRFDDLVPQAAKQVIWAKAPETRTKWAVVYIHGFSATLEELRPVPDHVAQALGANLVFTRLHGHGRGGAALGEASVKGWMQDVAEALAIGRGVGDRVLVISCSTGCTLVTLALHEPGMADAVEGTVFVSPNYRVKSPLAPVLTWPGARWWLPVLAGRERGFTPRTEGHARGWTTRYPSVALLPMGAAVRAAAGLRHEAAQVPALFVYDPGDTVVDHRATRAVAARWGGTSDVIKLSLGKGDDPGRHVVAGEIMSPGMTDRVVAGILEWLGKQASHDDRNRQ